MASAPFIENVLKDRLCPALRMGSRRQLIAALSNGVGKDRVGTIRTRHNNREITSLKEGLVIGRVTQCEHSHRGVTTALLQNLKRSTLADLCAE
jgi:hypothetical protein